MAASTPAPVPGGVFTLGALFVTSLLVRLIPARHGVIVDYDEGVYVTAAALLREGVLPYRDFVFLHPPGIALLTLPWTLGGPLFALNAARVVSAVLGALNTALGAKLVGGRGGIVAGVLWTVWPELVWSERGVFLEPWLTAFGLGALVLLTSGASARRVTLAGVLCGFALLVKAWGAAWCVAAFLACPAPLRRRLVLSAVVTVAAVMMPFLLASGGELFAQVVAAHVGRPPDGDLSRLVRLEELFVQRNPWPAVLAALAVPLVLWRGGPGRIALLGVALLVGAFLAAPAYWNQYNAAVVPFELWLIGAGLELAFERAGKAWWALGLVACAGALPSRRIAIASPAYNGPQLERVAPLREVKAELCAFEVAELVLANRLPARTRPVLVDSYGQGLLEVKRSGERFESAAAALASEAGQATLRRQLAECPAVSLGERGAAQLNAPSRALLEAQFIPGEGGTWVRR